MSIIKPANLDDQRANPDRSLNIFGDIDDAMVRHVQAEVSKLRGASSTDPITVYIDSGGGLLRCYQVIENILFTPDQNGETCPIITVGVGIAASAAARLLCCGDYTICYPSTLIHIHGARVEKLVTREVAEELSHDLIASNRGMAETFTIKSLELLPWRFHFNRLSRDAADESDESDDSEYSVEHFLDITERRISPANRHLVAEIRASLQDLQRLLSFLEARAPDATDPFAATRAVLDFIESDSSHDYTSIQQVVGEIQHIAFMVAERNQSFQRADWDQQDEALVLLSRTEDFLAVQKASSPAETQSIIERAVPTLITIWQIAFFLGLRLVKGENALTAFDAYHLGLVDEVLGTSLPTRRTVQEEESG